MKRIIVGVVIAAGVVLAAKAAETNVQKRARMALVLEKLRAGNASASERDAALSFLLSHHLGIYGLSRED
jgi:hypothetical protein